MDLTIASPTLSRPLINHSPVLCCSFASSHMDSLFTIQTQRQCTQEGEPGSEPESWKLSPSPNACYLSILFFFLIFFKDRAMFYFISFVIVAQSCPTLRDPMDCSLQGSSAHGIFQARVLEWVAISFSMSVHP